MHRRRMLCCSLRIVHAGGSVDQLLPRSIFLTLTLGTITIEPECHAGRFLQRKGHPHLRQCNDRRLFSSQSAADQCGFHADPRSWFFGEMETFVVVTGSGLRRPVRAGGGAESLD
jgi:hypothetical protein